MNTEIETWDQRMARERKEKAQRCQIFTAKMRKAFTLCGLKLMKEDSDTFQDRCKATLPNRSESAYLSASIGIYGHRDKILISLWFANQLTHRDVWGYNSQIEKINVSENKTAEQIAADVKRRILPKLAESITKADAVIQGRNNYENKTIETLKLIGAPIKRDTYGSKVNTNYYFDTGSAEVSGDSVRLSLHSVDGKTAKAIIDLLKNPS